MSTRNYNVDVELPQEGQASPPRFHLLDGRSSSAIVPRLFSVCIIASAVFVMYTFLLLFLSSFSAVTGLAIERQASPSSSVPQDVQTTTKLYAGQMGIQSVVRNA